MRRGVRRAAIVLVVGGLLVAGLTFAGAAPPSGPQERISRATAALDRVSSRVERARLEITRLQALGLTPPARLGEELAQGKAGVRAILSSLFGLHWDVVQPTLAAAHRIEAAIAELEKSLANRKLSAAMKSTATTLLAQSPTGNGAITGKVTDQTTGNPLASVQVAVNATSCCSSVTATTDASGNYLASGLATGTYTAYTINSLGYENELFNGIPCGPYGCYSGNGTPIAVTDGAVTPGVNFALEPFGSLSGTVTDATSGLPIGNVEVDLYDATGYSQGYTFTNAAGNYQFSQLAPGTYYALARSNAYINQLYQGIPCESGCTVTSGTPIAVSPGAVTGNIDFALQLAGSVSGTITDAALGTPLSATVYLYDSNGNYVTSAWTDYTGAYQVVGLQGGTYFAAAWNWQYAEMLYDGIICSPSCTVTNGTPISVTFGHDTPNIDFALLKFGSFSGRVTDLSTGLPVTTTSISAYDGGGSFVGYGYSDQTGDYAIGGLLTGNYFAVAHDPSYIDELYNGIVCEPSCDPTTGTTIAVTLGATTPGINFGMNLGGGIMGTVTDSLTGTQLYGIEVDIYDAAGNLEQTMYTNASGDFTVTGLLTGTYFARAWDSSYHAYLGQLFNGILCDPSCAVTTGTPIAVTQGHATSGVNFPLQKLGSIAGHVTDGTSGQPLSYQYVTVYDSQGTYVGNGYTDGTGAYTVQGLKTGTYFAMAAAWGYVTELYNGISCLTPCTVTSGTPISVVLGSVRTGVDFSLVRLGGITGTVTTAANGLPFPYVNIALYNTSGGLVGYSYSGSDGSFGFSGLQPGSYFATTQNNYGYVDELYDNLDCGGSCTVTSGTPIVVSLATVTAGVNFRLHLPYFADVPLNFWARRFIEACYVAGVTAGCSTQPMLYCPGTAVDRWQMAVFLSIALAGSNVPTSGTVPGMGDYNCIAGGQSVFGDVAPTDSGCKFIHYIAAKGITSGCGNGDYCPSLTVDRWQMAVFVAKAIATGPIPVSGTVPGLGAYDCEAGGTSVFGDVSPTDGGCRFIHYIAAQGITAGCGNGDYCPSTTITRDQSAVFLARGFGFNRYGP